MTIILAACGLGAAGLALFLTWRRRAQPRTAFRELWPVALAGGLPLLALLIENSDQGVFSTTEFLAAGAALALVLGGAVLSFSERRDERGRWAGSRALHALLTGTALLLLTLTLPVFAARVALPGQIAALPTATPGPTQTLNDVARGVYDRVLNVIADETGYDPQVISDRLDAGEASVADMVRETGGDLERVVQAITTVMNEQVQILAAEGRMDEGQAALAISAMETVVRAGVEFDLTNLMDRFEDP